MPYSTTEVSQRQDQGCSSRNCYDDHE